MTPELWEKMTPLEQGDFWWQELNEMLEKALREVKYQPGNQQTVIVPGMTTIVKQA